MYIESNSNGKEVKLKRNHKITKNEDIIQGNINNKTNHKTTYTKYHISNN